MTIILFIIILAALIFVHELGHFIAAKLSGMRVDEFALGFPPKIWSFTKGETRYSLNLIPFGGYVKILGEDAAEEGAPALSPQDSARSFGKSAKWKQALVLLAGVSMNILFAWLLISLGYVAGLPTSVSDTSTAQLSDAHVTVLEVVPDSPAAKAGFREGDMLLSLSSGADTLVPASVDDVRNFIGAHNGGKLSVSVKRGGDTLEREVVPEEGVILGQYGIGVAMNVVGKLQLPFFSAFAEGAKLTASLIKEIATGLAGFIFRAFTFHADFSQVSGPIGIVSQVGNVSELGWVYLVSFTAFISLNLAVLNLVPFPALDGGRILFVLIEAIKGSPIKPKVANAFNLGGFALLILLMVAVTFHDVLRFF